MKVEEEDEEEEKEFIPEQVEDISHIYALEGRQRSDAFELMGHG